MRRLQSMRFHQMFFEHRRGPAVTKELAAFHNPQRVKLVKGKKFKEC